MHRAGAVPRSEHNASAVVIIRIIAYNLAVPDRAAVLLDEHPASPAGGVVRDPAVINEESVALEVYPTAAARALVPLDAAVVNGVLDRLEQFGGAVRTVIVP